MRVYCRLPSDLGIQKMCSLTSKTLVKWTLVQRLTLGKISRSCGVGKKTNLLMNTGTDIAFLNQQELNYFLQGVT